MGPRGSVPSSKAMMVVVRTNMCFLFCFFAFSCTAAGLTWAGRRASKPKATYSEGLTKANVTKPTSMPLISTQWNQNSNILHYIYYLKPLFFLKHSYLECF
ncbi:hypothetical protein ES288_D02G097100v1 [Gossypium darwinii]|uniref:Uncharacterized protein n=2 Tax=Gossypium TaxID=3633 RepID=A0A5D2LVB4_GOSTO|nr:hypothetical protein ES288_D02G097100v1 [Gossypium darwinii]TYH82996.1 hypothetical protein ES332_D02G101300v1 [Gossypium tomentosum]